MAALPAVLRELQEQAAFRIYVTDALYAMGNNQRMIKRYADVIKPRKIDRRSAQEIADDIVNRCGLKQKSGDVDNECI